MPNWRVRRCQIGVVADAKLTLVGANLALVLRAPRDAGAVPLAHCTLLSLGLSRFGGASNASPCGVIT